MKEAQKVRRERERERERRETELNLPQCFLMMTSSMVSVPVLSVQSTSTLPRSIMDPMCFTIVFYEVKNGGENGKFSQAAVAYLLGDSVSGLRQVGIHKHGEHLRSVAISVTHPQRKTNKAK